MLHGIAIAFGSRRNEIFRTVFAGDVERVKRAQGTNFKGGDAVQGVVHRTGGAGEVEHVIDLSVVERLVDIELLEFEARFVAQMLEIRNFSGEQIVGREHRIPFGKQGSHKRRAASSPRRSQRRRSRPEWHNR